MHSLFAGRGHRLAIAAVLALRREGRSDLAVVVAAWLLVLGFDPVNSMLLNAFYAEAASLFSAVVTLPLISCTQEA